MSTKADESTNLQPAAEPPAAGPRRGFGVVRWILRVLILVIAGLACLQPVSIGEYLSGRYNMLAMHSGVATALESLAIFVPLAAIVYVVLGGRAWVLIVSVALFLAIELQAVLGYSRSLAVHIPLGVAIVGGAIVLAIWSCTPAASRFRPRRADLARPTTTEPDPARTEPDPTIAGQEDDR